MNVRVRPKLPLRRSVPFALAIVLVIAGCGNVPAGATDTPAPTVPPTAVPPTPSPTPRITPIPMDVTKEIFTDSVGQGDMASLTARTEVGARCVIEVLYASGPSGASGLEPKTASAAGKVLWSWRVGSNTAAGIYPITVTCTLDDHEGILELDFTVTR